MQENNGIDISLKNAISLVQKLRTERSMTYGDSIFFKDLSWFCTMLSEKLDRYKNLLVVYTDPEKDKTNFYETSFDTIMDLASYSMILLEKSYAKLKSDMSAFDKKTCRVFVNGIKLLGLVEVRENEIEINHGDELIASIPFARITKIEEISK